MNWLGPFWKECSRSDKRYCPGTCLEGPRKNTKNLGQDSLCPGRGLIRAPSDYESIALRYTISFGDSLYYGRWILMFRRNILLTPSGWSNFYGGKEDSEFLGTLVATYQSTRCHKPEVYIPRHFERPLSWFQSKFSLTFFRNERYPFWTNC
jgi:hypothetical protein